MVDLTDSAMKCFFDSIPLRRSSRGSLKCKAGTRTCWAPGTVNAILWAQLLVFEGGRSVISRSADSPAPESGLGEWKLSPMSFRDNLQ